jgi:hypothetical protein
VRATAAAVPLGGRRRLSSAQQSLVSSFAEQLVQRDPGGVLLAAVDDTDALARISVDQVLDSARVWEQHLGALYDVDAVRRLLGKPGTPVTRQAVSKRRGLLALTVGSGRVVYPAFQFVGGSPLPGLGDVLARLPESVVSRWTVASWLVSAEPELDGQRPVDVLRAGLVGAVTGSAERWAAQLGR